MAYKIVLTAIFMVLVSVAIACPRAAREDAEISAVLKDFIMVDQAGMILYSAGNPSELPAEQSVNVAPLTSLALPR